MNDHLSPIVSVFRSNGLEHTTTTDPSCRRLNHQQPNMPMPMPANTPTLHLPRVPTFPLSSPITEEIPSPVSSSSSVEERIRDRERDRGRDRNRNQNKPQVSTTACQTPFVHTSKDAHRSQMVVADGHSTNTDINTDTDENMDHLNIHGVARRPTGLNLLTNFDTLSVPKPMPMGKSKRMSRPRSHKRSPTFVDLNDLKSLCRTRERERSTQQRIKGILKRGRSKRAQHVPEPGTGMNTNMGMRASILDVQKEDHLTPYHPKKKRKSELSPSDRPIPIGFTISHVDSDEQPGHSTYTTREMQDDNQLTPLTPSIIVTPARDESSFWEDEEVDAYTDVEMNHTPPPPHPRPRIASSVYSQPTPLIDLDTEVPPVPAIPACHSSEKIAVATPRVQQRSAVGIPPAPAAAAPPVPATRNRTYSTGTVFEDDDSRREPTTSRSRSYSSGSGGGSRKSRGTGNRKTLDRLSINTDTNRPQSQGWWTYLLSPLLARSSTVTSGNTPTSPSGDRVPTLPKTRAAEAGAESTVSSEDWWEKEVEVSCFSPETPETPYGHGQRYPVGTRDLHVQGTNPFVDGRGEVQNTDTSANAGAGGVDIFAGQAIQGCAAEYYQACAHELFSGTPYFECENHVCSITPEDKRPMSQCQHHPDKLSHSQPEKVTPMSGKKGLALVEMDDSHTLQSPDAPSRAHRFSGSTAINDRNETPVYVNKGYFGTPIPTKPKRKPVGITVAGIPGLKPDQGYGSSLDKPEQQAATRPATPVTPFYIPPAPPTPLPPMNTTVTVERAIIPETGYQQPDPISPAFQQSQERSGIPLSNMHTHTHTHTHTEATSAPTQHTSPNTNTNVPQRPTPLPTTRGLSPSPSPSPSTPTRDRQRESSRIESRRQRHEKEEKVGKKASGLWRGRGPFSKKGCLGRDGREGRMKRRWYFALILLFLIILIIAILLAVFLTRKAGHSPTNTGDPSNDKPSTGGGDDTGPVESRWLNLTGYPPMPTGISTIAGPKPLHQESGCIQPSALWSCALPKEQQAENEPYKASEPNFKIQIRFRNGTYDHSTTVASSKSKRSNGGGWDAVPPAPSDKDQRFLGNTTDGNVAPFEGEETPFFITFLSPSESSSSSSHTRRAIPNQKPTLTRRASSSFPNLKDIIPSPATQKDNSPSPATLYPLPSSQPVRLYNRGKDDEHYGFYTYFDRSIFLQSSAPLDGGVSDDIEGDKDGGARVEDASVRCTWAQTRFLVQIWTNQEGGGKKVLLQSSPTSTSTSSAPTSTSSTDGAADYTRPGTLPYPITLTLDRHGGTPKKKMVYCYGIDDDGTMNATALKLQLEDRAYKGSLVNEAPGVFNNTDVVSGDDGDVEAKGGVDGGEGGCGCSWGNWVSLV